MAIEIERKFLVNDNSYLEQYSKHLRISQAYIFIEDNRVLRVRKIDSNCVFSLKIGLSQTKRLEFEYEIPESDADIIISNSKYNLVEKDRYHVEYAKKIWEVDVFRGLNEGLIIAEIEASASANYRLRRGLVAILRKNDVRGHENCDGDEQAGFHADFVVVMTGLGNANQSVAIFSARADEDCPGTWPMTTISPPCLCTSVRSSAGSSSTV